MVDLGGSLTGQVRAARESGSFLCHGKAAGRDGLGEAGRDFRQRLLESGAVEAAAGDGPPGDLEGASGDLLLIAHRGFDLLFNGGDLGGKLFLHSLQLFQLGGFGLQLKAEGDWNVDCHHTVEDTGIVLGRAFKQALGDRSGIVRYGHAMIPMDEALGFCAVDVSGRPYLVFDAAFPQERVGDFDTCMTEEFFRALSDNAGFTLHLRCPYGKNSHHMIEALFKACAHALCDATAENSTGAVLSTKGTLSE